ncbi:hypothetical protein Pelo_5438 [Pelomyxa schiedti]|nr:hypothetical protein Pelo_5438 [Pelomyxa schiedti]
MCFLLSLRKLVFFVFYPKSRYINANKYPSPFSRQSQGILVHNVVAPQSYVALKSAPTGSNNPGPPEYYRLLSIAYSTNLPSPSHSNSGSSSLTHTEPGTKLKWNSHIQRVDRFHVCCALAGGKFVVDVEHCTTTSLSPAALAASPKNPVAIPSHQKKGCEGNRSSSQLPIAILGTPAEPSDRPSMTGINHAWGYIV